MQDKCVRVDRKPRTKSTTRKTNAVAEAESKWTDLEWKGPLYGASFGLAAVSSVGFFMSVDWYFAAGGAAVVFLAEMTIAQSGAWLRENKSRAEKALTVAATVLAVGVSAVGGMVSLNAADAPRVRYQAALDARDVAQLRLSEAQAALDAMPGCTPDMPKVRCDALTENNAPLRADRTSVRDDAKAALAIAQVDLTNTPKPSLAGLPHMEWWQKLSVSACVAFVIWSVGFVKGKRKGDVKEVVEEPKKEPAKVEPKPLKINDGGWAKRRQRYGNSGRRSPR